MAALDRTDWPDARINDLHAQVQALMPMVPAMATLTEQMVGLGREISGLREDLTELRGNPYQEQRSRRTAIVAGVCAALAGGAFTSTVTLLLAGVIH